MNTTAWSFAESRSRGYEQGPEPQLMSGLTKTGRKHVLLLLPSAERVIQAELSIAIVASLLRCALFQQRWRLCGNRGVEGHDGAISEAGAFAEGRRC
jgi:hypothetical protein